ncbi:MAG: cytochrome c-type biogenesis protein CcmH, partial [Gammaproteobacteria bacterium]
MVERYGDFVLYRPPVKSSTLLLWLAPALLVATAAIVMVRLARRRVPPPAALSEAERARLAALVAAKRDDAPATDTHAGAHERRGEPPGPA